MEYCIHKMGVCAKCGADLHNCYVDHEFEYDGVAFHYVCGECGVSGSEWYHMEPIDNVAED